MGLEVTASRLREVINNFMEAALGGREADDFKAMSLLASRLDALSVCYHILEDFEPDDGPDHPASPHEEYLELYQRAGDRFPQLGYYPFVEPEGDVDAEVFLADAIDDIADIARDLVKVLWYLDQGRVTTATWDYRFTYEIHWGEHLLRLRHLLHHRLRNLAVP